MLTQTYTAASSWLQNQSMSLKDIIDILLTATLAFFTYRLWISTDRLWNAGERQIKIATNSAEAATKAAVAADSSAQVLTQINKGIAIEVPSQHNLNKMIRNDYPNSSTMPPKNIDANVEFKLRNFGQSPVTIHTLRVELRVSKQPPAFDEFAIEYPATLETYTMAPLEEIAALRISQSFVINWQDSKELAEGDLSVWLFGSVIYSDPLNNLTERKFIWLFDRRFRGLRPHDSRTVSY